MRSSWDGEHRSTPCRARADSEPALPSLPPSLPPSPPQTLDGGYGVIAAGAKAFERMKEKGGTAVLSLDTLRSSDSVPEALRCPLCRKLLEEAVLVLACDKVRPPSLPPSLPPFHAPGGLRRLRASGPLRQELPMPLRPRGVQEGRQPPCRH